MTSNLLDRWHDRTAWETEVMTRNATLTFDGRTIELPVIEGTEGELALDISELRARTGLITLDPGYGNTGACTSKITFIDGEKGILRYRGIPIEELAKHSTFTETAWLLIHGRLPTRAELARYRERLTYHAHLHEAFKHHFEGFLVDAPPMAILSAMVNTLSCFPCHSNEPQPTTEEGEFYEESAQLISKVRTIAAYSYRRSMGLPFIYPDPKLPYVANFLHMMFSMPYEQHVASHEVVDALNLILLLHADHEQNCSTSTVRVVGSSQQPFRLVRRGCRRRGALCMAAPTWPCSKCSSRFARGGCRPSRRSSWPRTPRAGSG